MAEHFDIIMCVDCPSPHLMVPVFQSLFPKKDYIFTSSEISINLKYNGQS